MAAAVAVRYLPQDLAMDIFHYEQQEDEPLSNSNNNNNSNGIGHAVHIFYLTVKPIYRACIIEKLNNKLGDGFEYVQEKLYCGFKNDDAGANVNFCVNLPMMQVYAIDQGLVNQALSEAQRQAFDQQIYSHIVVCDITLDVMDDELIEETQGWLESCVEEVRAQQVQSAGARLRSRLRSRRAERGHRKLSRRTRRRRTARRNGSRRVLHTRRRR